MNLVELWAVVGLGPCYLLGLLNLAGLYDWFPANNKISNFTVAAWQWQETRGLFGLWPTAPHRA